MKLILRRQMQLVGAAGALALTLLGLTSLVEKERGLKQRHQENTTKVQHKLYRGMKGTQPQEHEMNSGGSERAIHSKSARPGATPASSFQHSGGNKTSKGDEYVEFHDPLIPGEFLKVKQVRAGPSDNQPTQEIKQYCAVLVTKLQYHIKDAEHKYWLHVSSTIACLKKIIEIADETDLGVTQYNFICDAIMILFLEQHKDLFRTYTAYKLANPGQKLIRIFQIRYLDEIMGTQDYSSKASISQDRKLKFADGKRNPIQPLEATNQSLLEMEQLDGAKSDIDCCGEKSNYSAVLYYDGTDVVFHEKDASAKARKLSKQDPKPLAGNAVTLSPDWKRAAVQKIDKLIEQALTFTNYSDVDTPNNGRLKKILRDNFFMLIFDASVHELKKLNAKDLFVPGNALEKLYNFEHCTTYAQWFDNLQSFSSAIDIDTETRLLLMPAIESELTQLQRYGCRSMDDAVECLSKTIQHSAFRAVASQIHSAAMLAMGIRVMRKIMANDKGKSSLVCFGEIQHAKPHRAQARITIRTVNYFTTMYFGTF